MVVAHRAMVHGLRIEDGRARWYRNRCIRSGRVSKSLNEPRVPGPRHAFETVNTNVVQFVGRTLGLVEAGSTPVEIGETLEKLCYTDMAHVPKLSRNQYGEDLLCVTVLFHLISRAVLKVQ